MIIHSNPFIRSIRPRNDYATNRCWGLIMGFGWRFIFLNQGLADSADGAFFHLTSSLVMKFASAYAETAEDRDAREMKELHIGDPSLPIYSIPYEYVGNNTAPLYRRNVDPSQYTMNYPDWYKVTPAYQLSFAGMTMREHVTSFFTPGSSNSAPQRIERWIKEDKTVIYCDLVSKFAALASIAVLLMTLLTTTYQVYARAQSRYIPQLNNLSIEDMQRSIDRTAILNNWGTSGWWTIIKIVFSAIPAAVIICNVYKRTTLPKKFTCIKHIRHGSIVSTAPPSPLRRARSQTAMISVHRRVAISNTSNVSAARVHPTATNLHRSMSYSSVNGSLY